VPSATGTAQAERSSGLADGCPVPRPSSDSATRPASLTCPLSSSSRGSRIAAPDQPASMLPDGRGCRLPEVTPVAAGAVPAVSRSIARCARFLDAHAYACSPLILPRDGGKQKRADAPKVRCHGVHNATYAFDVCAKQHGV